MTTEHQKRLYMFPEMMGLVGTSNNETPLQILQSDKIGLLFQSHKRIRIQAKENICIQANDASLQSYKEIFVIQGGIEIEDEE